MQSIPALSPVGDRADVANRRDHYLAGGAACQTVKEMLAQLLIRRFETARKRFDTLMADRQRLSQILDSGAARASHVARKTLMTVRQAVGIDGMRAS
jgi:hypothetical protein